MLLQDYRCGTSALHQQLNFLILYKILICFSVLKYFAVSTEVNANAHKYCCEYLSKNKLTQSQNNNQFIIKLLIYFEAMYY